MLNIKKKISGKLEFYLYIYLCWRWGSGLKKKINSFWLYRIFFFFFNRPITVDLGGLRTWIAKIHIELTAIEMHFVKKKKL